MLHFRHHPPLSVMLVMTAAAAIGCDGGADITEPGVGTLEVTSTTTGSEPDPDGYTVQLDAEPAQAIEGSGKIRKTSVAAGPHALLLGSVAANCTVAGDNPRTVTIAAGETAAVGFTVSCVATSGSLRTTTSTSGPLPDPDGYIVAIDGTARGPLGSNAEAVHAGLTTGSHSVGLSGVAGNCRVEGDNPRSATISAGASTVAAFVIACHEPPATSGSLRVITVTGGASPDPNGYAFSVGGGGTQPIETNGVATVSNLAVGAHLVQLLDVATNCVVEGTNPRSASVVAGTATDVSFAVNCVPAAGSIVITTSSSGPREDGDGYAVSIDGGAARAIGINETLTISSITGGSHSVELSELSDLCHIEGENPRTISASSGSAIPVTFIVACTAPPAGPGIWNVAAPMPTPRQLVAGAVVRNTSGEYLFYTIGGSNPNNAAMQRMEVYNAATDTWARRANLPVKRALARADAIRGKIYVVGGIDLSGNATANLYIYDTKTESWAEGPSIPISTANSILGVIRDRLYVVTSSSPNSPTQALYRYDPETNTWARLADPTNNHFGGIGGVINSKLYVAWGRSHTVDVYDPVTNTWTNKLTAAYSGAPVYGAESICYEFCSVFGSAGVVLYDQLYVIGGLNDDESMPMAQAYDPIANTWTRKADMRSQREHSPVAGKIRNAAGLLQIIVVGGYDNSQGEDVTETEKYTP